MSTYFGSFLFCSHLMFSHLFKLFLILLTIFFGTFSFYYPLILVLPHFLSFWVDILFWLILVPSYFATISFFHAYLNSSSFYCFLSLNTFLTHFGSFLFCYLYISSGVFLNHSFHFLLFLNFYPFLSDIYFIILFPLNYSIFVIIILSILSLLLSHFYSFSCSSLFIFNSLPPNLF